MTETIIVHMRPTREQRKLKDGKNIATAKAKTIKMSLIKDEATSIAVSVGT